MPPRHLWAGWPCRRPIRRTLCHAITYIRGPLPFTRPRAATPSKLTLPPPQSAHYTPSISSKYINEKRGEPPSLRLISYPLVFVGSSRFELLTSCLSSKRSKPTELRTRMFCKDKAKYSILQIPAGISCIIACRACRSCHSGSSDRALFRRQHRRTSGRCPHLCDEG